MIPSRFSWYVRSGVWERECDVAFMVLSGAGYGKVIVRFQNAEEALAEARDQLEHGGQNIAIRISATGEELTVDEFAARIARDSGAG